MQSLKGPSKGPSSALALILICLGALHFVGCAGETTTEEGLDCERCDSAADDGVASLVDGTPAAVGLLRLLNDETTTFAVLDDDVPLDRRAAEALIAHRDGADGLFGSDDDDLFDDVAEVDGVSWVGESALASLLDYAADNGWIPTGDDHLGVYDGVSFTVREATEVLGFVNLATEVALDEEVGLDTRAVESIVAARPVASILALSELYYVGATALERLKAYVLGDEPVEGLEMGIISDLDKTVIPPNSDGLPDAPYPGVTELYNWLELGGEGDEGDMYYVTARQPDSAAEIPAWLEEQGLPAGPIATGVSGIPWVAEDEKVNDITAILEATPGQRFILFGDSNHVDYRVYGRIIEAYPDRIAAALIHRVRDFDEASLVEGIMVYDDYAHAAALLLSRGLIDEAAARRVMSSAQAEGLEITDAEIDQLIVDYRP